MDYKDDFTLNGESISMNNLLIKIARIKYKAPE